jgi:arginine decarboxylase
MPDGDSRGWTISQSAETYQVRGWGEPYFEVNDRGHVMVRPDPTQDRSIDLYDLVNDLQARGLALPLLLRFSNILEDRIRRINECFERAIKEYEYGGVYRGVFPVKVNQQRHLIDEVVRYGAPWSFGLEAGSKAELLIALSATYQSDGLIVCNGYKDLRYIETALIAQRMDKTVLVVLERIEELDTVFRASEKLGIRPLLGVRAKLGSKGIGRWKDSAGEGAKFGLTSPEIIAVVDQLAQRDMLDCLQLLHFHIGSQVSSILPMKNALREATRFYVELAKMGANMRYFDVGGGLAIDYDGSKSDFHASKNYSTQEYATDVVGAIQEACNTAGIPPATIISESGRAVAAHGSVLVFDVLGTNVTEYPPPVPPEKTDHAILHGLYETWKSVVPKNVQEAWHDAQQAKEEASSLFKFGYLTLRDRSRAELYFRACGQKILEQARRLKHMPEEIWELEKVLSAIYYCNFSVFQSAPDTWAIDQLFPIMPVHRLDEEPKVHARLADLTCDSDGIIDHFIDIEEVKSTIEVHPIRDGEQYLLAMFLMGAYQEILGDLHNLFGDTHAVHVRLAEENGYEVAAVVKGDQMNEVLRYVEYDPELMMERVRLQAEAALQKGRMTLPQMRLLMDHYDQSLRAYTYLTDEE